MLSFDKLNPYLPKFTLACQQLTIIKGGRDMKDHMPFHTHCHALSVCSMVMVQMAPFDPHL